MNTWEKLAVLAITLPVLTHHAQSDNPEASADVEVSASLDDLESHLGNFQGPYRLTDLGAMSLKATSCRSDGKIRVAGPISDEDIYELITQARPRLDTTWLLQGDAKVVRVYTGTGCGPLAGVGETLIYLRKGTSRWKLADVGSWIK